MLWKNGKAKTTRACGGIAVPARALTLTPLESGGTGLQAIQAVLYVQVSSKNQEKNVLASRPKLGFCETMLRSMCLSLGGYLTLQTGDLQPLTNQGLVMLSLRKIDNRLCPAVRLLFEVLCQREP
jgi:hypothetical protein